MADIALFGNHNRPPGNAAGSALIYSTYLGGSGDEEGVDIVVDSSGNTYVTGYTNSTDFPTAMSLTATKLK